MDQPRTTDISEATLDFFKGLRPPAGVRTRKGETIASLMVGGMSLVLGGICLTALLGYSPASLPDLVKRATIVVSDPALDLGEGDNPVLAYAPVVTTSGWWYVPDWGFWGLVMTGLLLGTLGIRPTPRGGRPITSVIGFALNGLAFLIGYVLALADNRIW